MRSRSSQSAFTLLEVLAVLLIISILMGIGVGAFSKVGGGPRLAQSQIREALRTTRHQARREHAPAAVLLDREAGTVAGVGWRRVGTWHFEEDREGAAPGWPAEVLLEEGRIAGGGVIGRCLSLRGEAPGATIVTHPALNSPAGISLDLFVQLDSAAPRILAGKGEFYALEIDDEGRLACRLKTVPAGAGAGQGVELYQLSAEGSPVPLRRWVAAALHFNGYACVLTLDGAVVAEERFAQRRRLLTDQVTPVRIGNVEEPFDGRVDELRIGVAVTGDELELPERVRIAAAPERVHFDRYGHLDRARHSGPVEIVLIHDESRRSTITVGALGEVWSP